MIELSPSHTSITCIFPPRCYPRLVVWSEPLRSRSATTRCPWSSCRSTSSRASRCPPALTWSCPARWWHVLPDRVSSHASTRSVFGHNIVWCHYIMVNIFQNACNRHPILALVDSISMALCKTAVTSLLKHWSYCSLALDYWYVYLLWFQSVVYVLSLSVYHCIQYCTILCMLTHWARDKMAAILQTTFSNAFSWMKIYEFRLIFHWILFLRVQLTISQHWFR